MYRVAIIEKNPEDREQVHSLVDAFFADNKENAAVVICASLEDLPRYYDCYLVGDDEKITLLCGGQELSQYGAVVKPLQEGEFSALLSRWYQSAPKTPHIPKRKVAGGL
ncbi:MAG: hypothetical protein RSC82_05970 [Oscillospiraceae bacterium]